MHAMSSRSKKAQQQTTGCALTPSKVNSPLLEKNSNSFSRADDSHLTLASLEDRLNKHADMIINRITDEFSKIRGELLGKLEQAELVWSEKLSKVNATIAEVVHRVECIEANSVNAHTLEKKLASVNADNAQRSTLFESNSAEMRELKNKIGLLQQQADATEKREIAADAVLFGVPCQPEENLTSLFNRLCLTAKCKPPTLKQIFRSRSLNTNSSMSPPIIIKFSNAQERNTLLKNVSEFRKQQKNHQLSLHDLGIESDKACFLNESLTRNTRTLLHHAFRLRNNHQLYSAYIVH